MRRALAFERQLRLLPLTLPLGIVLLLLAMAFSIASLLQLRTVRSNTERLDDSRKDLREVELRACERVNVLRGRVNGNGFTIYRVLRAAARSNSTAAREYRQIVASVEYAPYTNCVRAVDEVRTYTPPLAIRFATLERQGKLDFKTGKIKREGK